MHALRFAGIFTLALAGSATRSDAQGLEQPLRSSPPPDPAGTTQQLTLSARALGGYDDHLAPEGAAPIQSLDTVEGGYTGFADVSLRYWRGRPARSFSLDGSGYLLSYSNLSMDSPVGGQVRFGAGTTFGRSNRVEIAQQVSTDPYVAFGAFGPLRPDLGAGAGPDANPSNGLTPHRSWASTSSASVDWRWTPRTTMSAGYDYLRHEYIGDFGFDNRTHTMQLTLDRSLTRTFELRASYRYADRLVVDPSSDESWPLTDQTGEVGFGYAKGLSPTRRIEAEAGAGATRVLTVGRFALRRLEYWAPTGHAFARADIGRTWAVSAAYRRGVTVLDGITPESFLADVVLLRAEGIVSRRVELMFSTGYSNGKQPAGLLTGRYDTFTLSAQARVVVARSWAAVVNYNRNNYRLFGFPAPPLGPTARYDRNAIRVGMTYSFTLSPTRAERPARPGRTEN